jgi:anti-sigma-K factor RskA
MVHDDYKEMIPMHALSALDADDERALNEHLAQCAECRRDLAEWEATAASLALSAKPMEPSPQVREKLLTQIHAENPAASIPAEKSPSKVLPFPSPRRKMWVAIAAALFLALLVSVFVLWQQNRELRRQNQIAQVLNAPGSKLIELSGTKEASSATAKLAYDQTGRAVLFANGLPRAPEGKEYQLWYIVDNKPLPGKTFAPDNSGNGTLEDHVPEAARRSAIFAITLEPTGGVRAPTGAIYLRGEL